MAMRASAWANLRVEKKASSRVDSRLRDNAFKAEIDAALGARTICRRSRYGGTKLVFVTRKYIPID